MPGPANHAEVNDQIDRFDRDLSAAVSAGIPIDLGEPIGPGLGGRATIRKIHRLAQPEQSTKWPRRYAAAREYVSHTGDVTTAMNGLSVSAESRADLSRIAYPVAWYLVVLLLLCGGGLAYFTSTVWPAIGDLDPAARDRSLAAVTTPNLTISHGLMAICLTSAALMLGLLLSGRAHWITWPFGGRRYTQCRAASVAIKAIANLIFRVEDLPDAITTAAAMTGQHSSDQSILGSLQLTETPLSRVHDRMETLAQHMDAAAGVQLSTLRIGIPTVAVGILGGSLVLFYSLTLFVPLYHLLHGLATHVN